MNSTNYKDRFKHARKSKASFMLTSKNACDSFHGTYKKVKSPRDSRVVFISEGSRSPGPKPLGEVSH